MFKSKRYDDETLKHLQKVQTMILKKFIEICEENNITYFVYGGTLLGTIRHEGFIPWDDDIDVIMFRKDFEKFSKIMEQNDDDKYEFFNIFNKETYHHTWGKLTLKNTLFKDWWGDQVEYNPPIYIDVFILDNIPNNKFKRFIQKYSSYFLNIFTNYSYIKFNNESKLKEIIQQSIHYLLKIIPVSPDSIKKKCVETFSKYENEDCEEVCDFPAVCQMPVYYKTDWLPPKKGNFENLEVNIPNDYKKVLKRSYGDDYMQLPPKEERFRPAPEHIDFGEY